MKRCVLSARLNAGVDVCDLMLSGSEFHCLGAEMLSAQSPTFLFVRGTTSLYESSEERREREGV